MMKMKGRSNMRKSFGTIAMAIALCGFASLASAQTGSIQSKQLPISALQKFTPRTAHSADPSFTAGRVKYSPNGTKITAATSLATSGLPGVDSLTNWSDQFTEPGFDFNGNPQSVWPYTMVGNPPESNQSTTFRAPVVPVTVNLLAPDGTVAVFEGHPLSFVPTPAIVSAMVGSPVFQSWFYTSGVGQFNDQQMRAEFANRLHGNAWHNLLAPVVRTPRTMNIPFGFWYFFFDANNVPVAAAVDANTFGNLFFPATSPVDNSTPIGAAELSHDITTKDISTFAFNNVYLYQGVINNCCILGYHTYDFEPGNGENGIFAHLFVLNYSSWVSPGLFFFGVQDVTPLSHEMSETFNDPFVDNATPWYESVDPFLGSGLCQDNLETGDVIEVLTANPVAQVPMNGRTYHPQNVALFPWFAGQSPSPAHLGAYSFPDETTLPALSPGNLLPGCVPGP
jgi:hypothetical protein